MCIQRNTDVFDYCRTRLLTHSMMLSKDKSSLGHQSPKRNQKSGNARNNHKQQRILWVHLILRRNSQNEFVRKTFQTRRIESCSMESGNLDVILVLLSERILQIVTARRLCFAIGIRMRRRSLHNISL